jgi:cell division protein FtsX
VNATERRLADALQTVGGTLGPGDVPPLDLSSKRRRSVLDRPLILAAAAASVAAIVVGAGAAAVTIGGSQPDREPGPLTRQAGRNNNVVVYLCQRTSSNPVCGGKDTTQAQTDALSKELAALPWVQRVDYESKQEAFERLKKRFEKQPGFVESPREGDIPDSFRVTVRDPGDRSKVGQAMIGRPGVDQVVSEGA